MIELDALTYAAVIEIHLPGMDESATITITLAPPDLVQMGNGSVKPLRDCTLAELQAYALALEGELLADFAARRLGDLARDEAAQVDVTILDQAGAPVEHFETWLVGPTAETTNDDRLPAAVKEREKESAEVQVAVEDGPPVVEPKTELAAPPVVEEVKTPLLEPMPPAQETLVETDVEQPPVVPHVPEIRVAGRRRPAGHPTWATVDILINEPAFREAQAHALRSLEHEVAGVLVGPLPEKQPDGRYLVHVTDTIIARHTRMHGASVTYTPESWRYVTDVLAERYPDESAVMVGWYHTHPGFGIFLSGMDLFIHQNFFTQSWHIALVLDPIAHKSGFFCWDRQKSQVKPYDLPWPAWAHGSW